MWSRRGVIARPRNHQRLYDLETSLTDPTVRRSVERLEDLLHPEFIELGSSGKVYDRPTIIETMSNETGTAGVVIRDFDVHIVSEQTHLVTYRSIGESGDEARRSSLWINTDSGWRIRFHQGTRIPNHWGNIS